MARSREPSTGTPPILSPSFLEWPPFSMALPKAPEGPLRAQRPRLLEALRSLGCTVWAGEANYLLFRAPGVADLKERLLERNILIRSCANYHGLGPDFYRVCVRREEEKK